ncbi:VIT family protein [Sphingomonas sp. ASV193]|uniref:VIT1/CCC1 transporter family protein n=1 Tax=Sphingomonas sp. ASV193 TaxID=3144405 RepID=UPI0032E8E0CC
MTAQADPAEPNAGTEHYVNRSGWLRAAVLGANDGLLSTGSLMIGVAAASVSAQHLILTGVAGIAAGAMSMAAGEYVSVSSQADIERSELAREKQSLANDPEGEQAQLAKVYEERGVKPELAEKVAEQLSAEDALAAHARDELGITDELSANPIQAAIASAASFLVGGAAPLITALLVRGPAVVWAIPAVTVVVLAILGALGAKTGGAPLLKGTVRVVVFGTIAMAVTALVGRLFAGVTGI